MDLGGSTNRAVGVEIAEGGLSSRRRHCTNDLTDFVFSWSLHDILNENLYQDEVSFYSFLIFAFFVLSSTVGFILVEVR